MIKTKADLKEYIVKDAAACKRKSTKASLMGDECWKYQVALRKAEFYKNSKSSLKKLCPAYYISKIKFHKLGVKLGFSLPLNAIGPGLSIAHYGTIVINGAARIGENCRIHVGVTIGASGGSDKAPQIGNNVYIGTGAKIIGDITIADGVAIGANAVVNKSITEPNTSWAGVPAKKISDKGAEFAR